jgi:hypothetical protein
MSSQQHELIMWHRSSPKTKSRLITAPVKVRCDYAGDNGPFCVYEQATFTRVFSAHQIKVPGDLHDAAVASGNYKLLPSSDCKQGEPWHELMALLRHCSSPCLSSLVLCVFCQVT